MCYVYECMYYGLCFGVFDLSLVTLNSTVWYRTFVRISVHLCYIWQSENGTLYTHGYGVIFSYYGVWYGGSMMSYVCTSVVRKYSSVHGV